MKISLASLFASLVFCGVTLSVYALPVGVKCPDSIELAATPLLVHSAPMQLAVFFFRACFQALLIGYKMWLVADLVQFPLCLAQNLGFLQILYLPQLTLIQKTIRLSITLLTVLLSSILQVRTWLVLPVVIPIPRGKL